MYEFNKLLTALSILVATLILPRVAFAGDVVGVRQITVQSSERTQGIDTTVWYPADAGGKAAVLGESRFFSGTPAMRDAPISGGRYPVILLSHGAGLGGTPEAMSWIAVPLAMHDYIVVAPTHYGNGGTIRSAAETMKLWLRPTDISAALGAIENAPPFEDHIADGKIGALGLSMGGNTVLQLAGGRIDPARLANYCDDINHNSSLCGWVKQSGADLHSMNMKPAERDNTDSRIRFAMAIDPAPVDVFRIDSFSRIRIPMEIVNLGRPASIPPTALALEVAKLIPSGVYSIIKDASHFSMFGECKPGAAEMARAEDIEEPICSDGGGRPRREIQKEMVDLAVRAFDRHLKTKAR